MPLAAGMVVNGRYRIIKLLGQGGFGAVYQAWDENLDRPCALKENLETSDELSRQFEREARLLANLNHPNLPRVTDHFRIPNQGQYLVMDFIEGEDLDQRLHRIGRALPEAEVLDWILQVCDALSYLHHHDPPIIHRDVKPANIRITPKGRAMLVDFGIAKMYSPSMRTTVGARAVTPGFSPPEQYGTGTTDERSDIYSLGATMYSLLTGYTPPESVDLLAGNVPALRPAHELNPLVSPRLSSAIAQAMHPARMQRFQTMNAFCEALSPPPARPAAYATPEIPSAQVVNQLVGRLGPQPVAGGAGNGPGSDVPDARVYASPEARGTSERAAVPASRIIRAPRSRPRRVRSWLLFVTLIGGIILLGGVGMAVVASMLNNQAAGTPGSAGQLPPGLTAPAVTTPQNGQQATKPPQNETQAPSVEPATQAPQPQLPSGVVQISLPQTRLAFVSDHREDKADRIYTLNILGGDFWYQPESGKYYSVSAGNEPVPGPYSAITQVPADESHNVAWWPEWCADDSLILFEAQDTGDPNYQTIYSVSSDPFAGDTLKELHWPGYRMLGVPRCSHKGSGVVLSALIDAPGATWELYTLNLDDPTQGRMVYDGFPFAGNADWSGDDSWIVFMRRLMNEKSFWLVRLPWSNPSNFTNLPHWNDVSDAKYPAVSPTTGEIAFACSDSVNWNLCLADSDGQNMRVLLKGLAGINNTARPKPKAMVPAVTPRWSADGRWIAFSSNQDGDWDVYLYNPGLNLTINLTNGLTGDQFQPAWSKR